MAVSRSAASQPRAWFPPATFQMRLRGLRSIIYVASSLPRKTIYREGSFHITIHENSSEECIPIWKSDPLEWSADRQERLTWADIDLGGGTGFTSVSGSLAPVNLGRQSVVVRVWFTPLPGSDATQNDEVLVDPAVNKTILETSWEVNFSGLICLGINPPAHGRLPPDFLVFHISGSYFTSPFESAVSKGNCIPRYLHIFDSSDKKQKESCIKSYDTGLLLRLHRIQRALIKQESANSRIKLELKQLGILDSSEIDKNSAPDDRRSPQLTLRECVFATKRVKTSATRIAESSLKFQLESVQVRCKLLAKEKLETTEKLKEIEKKSTAMKEELDRKNTVLMDNVRTLSREKSKFARWFESFNSDVQAQGKWSSALKEQRLHVIRSFNKVFPIELGKEIGTMRSISLPNVDKFKEFSNRYEDLSVVIGWVVNLLNTFAYVLDAPLRYPVKLLGSHSSIIDHVKVLDENKTVSREFPLYLKSSKSSKTDWDRFAYGIYLLNKNLAQLRWQCGKPTKDLRPLLQNVADLMVLGKDSFTVQEIVNALPRIRSLTLPPRSTSSDAVSSLRSPNGVGVSSNVSKVIGKQTSIPTKESAGVRYAGGADGECNSQTTLQSQMPRGISQNQRNDHKDCEIKKVASISSIDRKKAPFNDEEENANASNTRSMSSSSSSSYDTIEEDKMSDDITDTTSNQSNVKNECSQNVPSIVRIIAKDSDENLMSHEKGNGDNRMNGRNEEDKCTQKQVEINSFPNLNSQEANESFESDNEDVHEENLNTLFWGDMTSRTSALSKPSSFQRPRANH